MSALADDYQRDRKPVGPEEYTVKNDEIIYSGALCNIDSTGELVAATDTAGEMFAGVNYGDRCDNSDDGEVCQVDKAQKFNVAGTGFSAADIGKSVYVLTDNSVALSAGVTNHVYVGKICQVDSATSIWVDPTVGDDDVDAASAEVADPASAVSTDGLLASIASSLKAVPSAVSTDGLLASIASGLKAVPSAVSTDGLLTSIASGLVAVPSAVSTDGLLASIASSLVAVPSATSTDGVLASVASGIVGTVSVTGTVSELLSASFSSPVVSSEMVAYSSLVGHLVADIASLVSAVETNASVTSAALTEAELATDDVRALRASLASNVPIYASVVAEAELVGDDVRALRASLASNVPIYASVVTEAELVGDDVRALRTSMASNVPIYASHIAQAELAADDGRVARTAAAAAITALKTLGLFTDPS